MDQLSKTNLKQNKAREYHKEYKLKNPEKIKEIEKRCYEKLKQEKYLCEVCYKKVSKIFKFKHEKTKLHKRNILIKVHNIDERDIPPELLRKKKAPKAAAP